MVEGFVIRQSLEGLITLRWLEAVARGNKSTTYFEEVLSSFSLNSHSSITNGQASVNPDKTLTGIETCQKVLERAGIRSILKSGRLTVILPEDEEDGEKSDNVFRGTDANFTVSMLTQDSERTSQKPKPDSGPIFEIASQKCPTCIFGPNSPLRPGRLKEHISEILQADSYAVCHHAQITLGDQSRICCRGFFEAYGKASLTPRLAEYLGIVREVMLPTAMPSLHSFNQHKQESDFS